MRYSDISHWLATAGDLAPRPSLVGDHDVDVVIVGAGFTGLWTAWYLQQREPTLRIAICEAEIAGFGASGRNGAWCSAGIGMTAEGLARRYDAATARDVISAMRATVDEIGRVCDTAGIDAEFRKSGMLRVARGDHEAAAVDASVAAYHRLGLDQGLVQLSTADLDARVRIAGARGGVFDPHCATLHPGHLVRGLASAVEQRGATLWERTRIARIDPAHNRADIDATGDRPIVHSRRGRVRAGAVVVATEAWTSHLPGHRRAVLPVY
ncbi:MAG TPA: FAD-dependent oxidoreductase, partial [Euzebyales bacterium]|nr:FAD-dependent oxidoreductase [Euzebyales bacterium]